MKTYDTCENPTKQYVSQFQQLLSIVGEIAECFNAVQYMIYRFVWIVCKNFVQLGNG